MTSGKPKTSKSTNPQRRASGKRLNIDVNAETVGIVSQLAGVATEPANTIFLNQISLSSSQPRRYFDPQKAQAVCGIGKARWDFTANACQTDRR
jgi:hypothetical protein